MKSFALTLDLNHITNDKIVLEGISYIILDRRAYIRKKPCLPRFPMRLKYTCYKISIDYKITTKGKEIPDTKLPKDLISLYIPQHDKKKVASEHSNISVGKDGKLDFRLLFNLTALPYINKDSIHICFNIVFQPTQREKGIETPYELEVIKQKANPAFTFALKDEWKSTKMYESCQIELGTLTIKNSTSCNFAHLLNLQDIKLEFREKGGLEIHEGLIHPQINPHANGQNLDEGEDEAGRYYLKNFFPQKSSSSLWEIDLARVDHPQKEIKFELYLIGKIKLDNSGLFDERKILLTEFTIIPNTITPELVVEYGSIQITEEDEEISLKDRKYNLQATHDHVEVTTGKIRNRATVDNPNAEIRSIQIKRIGFGVYIDNAIPNPFDEEEKIDDIIRFKLKLPNAHDWIMVEKELIEDIPLPNDPTSIIQYQIIYRDADFACLPPAEKNSMRIHISIEIGYLKIGAEGLSRHANRNIHFVFNIQQFEGKNWLAVDLGTSAIVAKYGNQIINLQRAMEKKQKKNKRIYSENEIEEFGTQFLSSTLLLDKDHLLQLCNNTTPDDLISTIELSPDIRTINENYMFLCPFVKSLIGYKEIPLDILNKKLLKFNGGAQRLSVAHLIKATYLYFFKNYLEPQLNEVEEKNKIVVTVPNVFTSRQKEIIKEVIKETFPSIWEDAIYFISESDAIAWYYYTNRGRLGDNNTQGETILVYDMGAGTLDLTLFKCDPSVNEPIILSKVGLTIAGNYLDTILADVVFKQLTDAANPIIKINTKEFHPVNNFKNFEEDAIAYKKFIRNILKPALSDSNFAKTAAKEEFKFKLADTKFSLNKIQLKKIKEASTEYTGYLKRVSEKVIDLLKKNTIEGYEDFRIDGLLLAGRGAQITDLKTKLHESTGRPRLVSLKPEEMKSIVVEGALECMYFLNGRGDEYFKQEKIYARIGILIERMNGKEYEELISPKHQEILTRNHNFETSKRGYLLEYTINHMDNIRRIVILQTFQDENGIICHLSDEDFFDTSTIIAEFDRSVIGEGIGYIKILICEDGEVLIRLNDVICSVNPTIDIKKSTAFKMSMWPIINYD